RIGLRFRMPPRRYMVSRRHEKSAKLHLTLLVTLRVAHRPNRSSIIVRLLVLDKNPRRDEGWFEEIANAIAF
ncbi:MAG: hypothetical protein ACREML_01870, partial [Vulcanimicrobiaceae bacterium]